MKSWSVVSALATTLGVCGYIARTDVLSLGNRPEKATPPERVLTWAQWGAAALLNADDRWQVVIVGSLALAFLAFVVGSINDAFRDEPSQIYVGKRENSFWIILRRVWPIDDLLIAHMSRTFYYGLIVLLCYKMASYAIMIACRSKRYPQRNGALRSTWTSWHRPWGTRIASPLFICTRGVFSYRGIARASNQWQPVSRPSVFGQRTNQCTTSWHKRIGAIERFLQKSMKRRYRRSKGTARFALGSSMIPGFRRKARSRSASRISIVGNSANKPSVRSP